MQLDRLGVDYQEVDISVDDQARSYLMDKNMLNLPVVETDNDIFSGFRPDKLKALSLEIIAVA